MQNLVERIHEELDELYRQEASVSESLRQQVVDEITRLENILKHIDDDG